MKKRYLLVVILLICLLMSGCWPFSKKPVEPIVVNSTNIILEPVMLICPNNVWVNDSSLCIDELNKEVTQKLLAEELKRNESLFKIEEQEKKKQTITRKIKNKIYLDLDNWKMDDIIRLMGNIDYNLKGIIPSEVFYSKWDDDQSYSVWRYRVYDPFYVMRYEYGNKAKEYTPYHLRVEVWEDPNVLIKKLNDRKNNTEYMALYPDIYKMWSEIKCEKVVSCRDIEAVRCYKNGHTLYHWNFQKDPAKGITYRMRYNMQAIDDKGVALKVFEKFYCTPIKVEYEEILSPDNVERQQQ